MQILSMTARDRHRGRYPPAHGRAGGPRAMSKASEWAMKGGPYHGRPRLRFGASSAVWAGVHLSTFGPRRPYLSVKPWTFNTQQALMLARWILDTFGEPTP